MARLQIGPSGRSFLDFDPADPERLAIAVQVINGCSRDKDHTVEWLADKVKDWAGTSVFTFETTCLTHTIHLIP